MFSKAVHTIAPRVGLQVRPLGKGAWLVQRAATGRRPLRAERVEPGTWLVQRPGRDRYRMREVGPKASRTRLLYKPQAARATVHAVQRELGEFLLEEQAMWILDRLRINCVLDVGANAGQFAQALRGAGYTGRIVSFEPLAEFADILRSAAADDPDWIVCQYALGDTDSSAEINATPGKTLSSLLPASEFGKEWNSTLRDSVHETVSVRRLDSVLDEALAGLDDPRIFLKLDTQGFDLQAVRGAGERLGEVVGLQSEVSCLPIYEQMPPMEEALAEYRSAGFDIAGMYPVGRHRPTGRVIEFDVLMVRPGAFGEAGPDAGAAVDATESAR
jgi:FkbM family methyltransferase